jgi:hypothetical protein
MAEDPREDTEVYSLDDLLSMGKNLRVDRLGGNGGTHGYFLAKRLLRVRDRNGQTKRLKANAAQQLFEEKRGQRNIVLKARQMGITTWIAGRFFLKTITAHGVLSVQVAQTREAAEGIFGIAQRMWENLPRPLREGPLRRSRANVGQMVFPELDSEFRVVSAADENAGRGLTIQNLHCSEVGRWPGDAAATLAGLRAALAPGGEACLESTPRGAYGCFYEEWMQAGETGTVQHFFPWWLEPHYIGAPASDFTAEEMGLMLEHRLTDRQIGYRRGLQQSFRGLRAQEYAEDPASCFRATGQCCFEIEKVEARLAEVPPPIATRRGGALHSWLPPLPGKEYLVAVDSAGGGSDGDFAAIQVIELASGLQCAELRERLGTLELARVAAQLGREYRGPSGPAMVCVERNNHGSGVLAYLDSVEEYPWVYEHDGVAGWLTTAGNKPAMVSRIGALLEDRADLFRSARLLEECRTFVAGPGGKTGAAQGAHDDWLMAMAVAHAVRSERLGLR